MFADIDFSFSSKIEFPTPIRSMWMPRSIEVLKDDQNYNAFSSFAIRKSIDALVFSGPEQFFNGARHIFSFGANIDYIPVSGRKEPLLSLEVQEIRHL